MILKVKKLYKPLSYNNASDICSHDSVSKVNNRSDINVAPTITLAF